MPSLPEWIFFRCVMVFLTLLRFKVWRNEFEILRAFSWSCEWWYKRRQFLNYFFILIKIFLFKEIWILLPFTTSFTTSAAVQLELFKIFELVRHTLILKNVRFSQKLRRPFQILGKPCRIKKDDFFLFQVMETFVSLARCDFFFQI